MASPRAIGFTVYDLAGAPLAGAVPVFTVYCDQAGTDILPVPAIIEIKGGGYYFIPTLVAGSNLYYTIDCGANTLDRYQTGLVRPESFDVDLLPTIDASAAIAATQATLGAKFGGNSSEIPTAGPNLNTEIVYDDDGVSVLAQYDLFDENGNPTIGPSIVKRTKR